MIEIKNITKYYGKGESRFKALDDVSMNIKDGEFLVILGASGSGKSTFLNVISGLETLDDGEVIYNEQHLEKMNEKELTKFRRDNVSFIFQQYYLLPHLDEKTGRSVLDYIIKLQEKEKFTMIMVTHNANIAETADRTIKMNSGKIVDTYDNLNKKSAYEIGW